MKATGRHLRICFKPRSMLHLARHIPVCPHCCFTPHEHSEWLMLVLQDGMPQIQCTGSLPIPSYPGTSADSLCFWNTILKRSWSSSHLCISAPLWRLSSLTCWWLPRRCFSAGTAIVLFTNRTFTLYNRSSVFGVELTRHFRDALELHQSAHWDHAKTDFSFPFPQIEPFGIPAGFPKACRNKSATGFKGHCGRREGAQLAAWLCKYHFCRPKDICKTSNEC